MARQILASRSEFSQRTRAYNLARLRAELFDVVVIGGGIVGAGIAREAVLRGYKVALVEKNDFASGSSSQSSKLLQSSIRHLENLQLPQMYQAGLERDRLLRMAPTLTWPMPFLYPIHRNGPYAPERVNQGLWAYDALAFLGIGRRHHMLTAAQTTAAAPELDAAQIAGGGEYFEAQMDDARLTLETVRAAYRHGAVIVNHFQIVELLRSAGKRIDGVLGHDLVANEYVSIRARVVVNAAGPWAELVLALDDPRYKPRWLTAKGVHLVIPHARFPVQQVISFVVPNDGHLMYVMPRDGGYTLIGTTASEYTGDLDQVHATPEDVDYILGAVNAEFPRLQLGLSDVVSTYAGVWPHLAPEAYGSLPMLARDYDIWVTPSGLVNIAGGRFTIHRVMAQDLVVRLDKILRRDFGVRPAHSSQSARLPLLEWSGKGEVLTRAQSETLDSLPQATRDYFARTYGVRQGRVLDYIRGDSKLRAPIVDGFPYLWAEVPHAIEHEMAITVDDIMMRRLDLFHQVPDGAVEAAQEVGRYMSRLVDWLDPDIDHQIMVYDQAVAMNRQALHG
ncbi:MAG: glycerol-3-phosphate dehydrogenase/oxidase [Anaerolineae bacterium]